MEISKTTLAGFEVNVIFTGSSYFFHNQFHGVIAIANRISGPDGFDTNKQSFEIVVGSSSCLGSSLADCTVMAAVKRFVNKNENRYISVAVSYEVKKYDLSKGCLSVSFVECGSR